MASAVESNIVSYAKVAEGARTAAETGDRIDSVKVSLIFLPLATPVSDAKVLTGRQKPLTEIAFIFAEIRTRDGLDGIGFGYSKRAGGPGMYAHAKEIAPNLLGEDPSDIQKIFTKLLWAGASMGRSGMTTQAIAPFDIALWDLKSKRAKLPLAKLLGAHRDSVQCYNTSGGYLHTPLDQVLKNVEISQRSGIGGIKLKVGQPDLSIDIERVGAVRKLLGDSFPLMVDANQQWDRQKATRACRAFEGFDLTWIEEPLDAYDFEGHAQLATRFDTAIATGEMLTSAGEHAQLILAEGSDFIQPDAPRVGGITPFLEIMALGAMKGRKLAPHFAMEIHLHLAAAYPIEPWLEHFEWLGPMFNEQMHLQDGRMHVSDRHGLGFSLSEQAISWRADSETFGKAS
ncbi:MULTISPECIES: L-talarate/galactarate dehydratase [Variovorax]|jgi:L-talarate/galactarate dehydratase|uniref:L-talarate/galactarate dehydratase n=1 Tax=Variovorax TaxID=34072 RepID=UPI00086CE4BD|nr:MULTISPECIES: mandelate racemase/muconate lactonizing enzyme family protein [Variovorax]ODS96149.1 MAG: mandelate racemase/muconate lactonizing protein [Lautropia sp. SCN 69-89]MBN8758712.1 mandelate racemase/muconate lactonizing enzyme family protein [Variovorax sp.]ODV17318.1 MAG: mandelate racemase/muconate lactonizing protein [Variovorax sp. SCN 67-20]OJZ04500.1 MAG: mandelate racemase/muconate lactonizing protein [Variovorax sp. 67-131]UKI07679.1 mandelate racemase/muconate lactonizing